MTAGISSSTWVLGADSGWRLAESRGLHETVRELRLDPLPGKAAPVLDVAGNPLDLQAPGKLTGSPERGLFVIDVDASLVKRLRPSRSAEDDGVHYRLDALPTIGGGGTSPRRFTRPRGLALLASGATAVADTGNHRVQIFSDAPLYALLHVWGTTDALGQPAAGAGPMEFRDPWGIAAGPDGTIYVADRGNRRVQVIAGDGTWMRDLGAGILRDPTQIAASKGAVAVLDEGAKSVVVFDCRRALPRLLGGVTEPASLAFSPEGNLYVGDAIGRICVFDAAAGFKLAGAGVTGVDGAVADLWWDAGKLLATIEETGDAVRRRLWQVNPSGGSAIHGQCVTARLDSTLDRCRWHRVLLDATVPQGTSIEVDSHTTDSSDAADPTGRDFDDWTHCIRAGDAVDGASLDGLVHSGPGRYLWLRLTLRSSGAASPELRRVTISYPRASYLDYLPALYQEDEESRQFLDRFLSIFQSGFDDFDEKIDGIADLFDPDLVPAAHLRWLAGWLALFVDPTWDAATRDRKVRALLKDASRQYSERGTVRGLERLIEQYAEVRPARVLEHFRLRRWAMLSDTAALDGTSPLWSRDFYKRLQVTSYSQV